MIIGGITTDVCKSACPSCEFARIKILVLISVTGVAELALSLRAEGYHVAVNTEASGTFSQRVADYAFSRMQAAGVLVMNMFSIVSWRVSTENKSR